MKNGHGGALFGITIGLGKLGLYPPTMSLVNDSTPLGFTYKKILTEILNSNYPHAPVGKINTSNHVSFTCPYYYIYIHIYSYDQNFELN